LVRSDDERAEHADSRAVEAFDQVAVPLGVLAVDSLVKILE